MKEETSIDIKVSGIIDLIAEREGRIWVFDLDNGERNSGMLLGVRNDHFLFEKKNGTRLLVRQDAIKSAFEVEPGRR